MAQGPRWPAQSPYGRHRRSLARAEPVQSAQGPRWPAQSPYDRHRAYQHTTDTGRTGSVRAAAALCRVGDARAGLRIVVSTPAAGYRAIREAGFDCGRIRLLCSWVTRGSGCPADDGTAGLARVDVTRWRGDTSAGSTVYPPRVGRRPAWTARHTACMPHGLHATQAAWGPHRLPATPHAQPVQPLCGVHQVCATQGAGTPGAAAEGRDRVCRCGAVLRVRVSRSGR
jgi:hypothetical protein